MRFDFVKFELRQPYSGSDGTYVKGYCAYDVFTITAPETNMPAICGKNTGYHSKFPKYLICPLSFCMSDGRCSVGTGLLCEVTLRSRQNDFRDRQNTYTVYNTLYLCCHGVGQVEHSI